MSHGIKVNISTPSRTVRTSKDKDIPRSQPYNKHPKGQ